MCEHAARTLSTVATDVFDLKFTVAHCWPSAASNFAHPASARTPPAAAIATAARRWLATRLESGTSASLVRPWTPHSPGRDRPPSRARGLQRAPLSAGGIMAALIEDYALIGDMHTAALVGRDGSVDWLCVPRFDSAACLAALLGDERHGTWRISPVAADGPPSRRGQVTRSYRDSTLILETEWQTVGGTVRVIDFMPPRQDEAPVLIRIVEGVQGAVEMECTWRLRFDYGK